MNDVLTLMEKEYPIEMEIFYKTLHLSKSGQGPGGQLNGPSKKLIMNEENINNQLIIHITLVKDSSICTLLYLNKCVLTYYFHYLIVIFNHFLSSAK